MGSHKEKMLGMLEAVSRKMIEAEKTLTDLDAVIGDGDCGSCIRLGFQTVLDKLPSLKEQNMGTILKQVGMALTSSIGGSSGAIFGTAFMRMGGKIGEKESVTLRDIHEALCAALEGVKVRGEGTQIGDKTLVDALEPAIDEIGKAAAEGLDTKSAVSRATEAARKGSDSTIPLIARKGRASYLGERSIGHRDAGSMAICLMFEAVNNYL